MIKILQNRMRDNLIKSSLLLTYAYTKKSCTHVILMHVQKHDLNYRLDRLPVDQSDETKRKSLCEDLVGRKTGSTGSFPF